MQSPRHMLSCIDPIGAVSVQWINDQQTTKSLSDYGSHGGVKIYCVRNPCFINSVITCSAEPVGFITHFPSPEQDLCTSPRALRSLHFFSAPCLSLVPCGLAAICLGRAVCRKEDFKDAGALLWKLTDGIPTFRTVALVLGYTPSPGRRKPGV